MYFRTFQRLLSTIIARASFIPSTKLRPILPRTVHAFVILSLLLSSLSVGVEAARYSLSNDDIEEAIKAIADEPLFSTPLQLRDAVFTTLFPVASTNPHPQEKQHVLPIEMLMLLNEDSEMYFFDEGRISDVIVMDHDWELAKRLVKLLQDKKISGQLKEKYLQGLLLLLRADKHLAELAVYDAKVIVDGLDATDEITTSDRNKALSSLNTAEIRFRNGLEALRRGDGDSAVHHFDKAWSFSERVFSQWDLRLDGDFDEDDLLDILELRLGTSVFADDTDGDGLSDLYEFENLFPHTLPTDEDTDADGVYDGDEDLDGDLIVNADERDWGTDPLLLDTDGDGLDDNQEIGNPSLNPLDPDTDGDGLPDGSELRLGTNPMNHDTDNDGIPDGEDTHFQILENPNLGVMVELEGVGDHSLSFRAHSLVSVAGFKDVPGLIGEFVDLTTDLPLSSARVYLEFNPALVPGEDFTNLRLFQYDIENLELVLMPDQSIDTEGFEISAATDELSPTGVVYLPTWESATACLDDSNAFATSEGENLHSSSTDAVEPVVYSLSLRGWQAASGILQATSTPDELTPTPEATSTPTDTPTSTSTNTPTSTPTYTPTATPTQTSTPTDTPTSTVTTEGGGIPEGEEPDRFPTLEPLIALSSAESRHFGAATTATDGGEIVIGGGTADQHAPVVAFNQTDQQYLVVWLDETEPTSFRGRLISVTGEPASDEFTIIEGALAPVSMPELLYNRVENTYLLVWQELNGQISVEEYYYGTIIYTIPRANLYTLPIAADGTPLVESPTLITDELTDWDRRYEFDVAFNPLANEYFVTWVQPRGGIYGSIVYPHRLMGQRLDAIGKPKGGSLILRPTVGTDIRVEHSAASNEYLITFSLYFMSSLQYELYILRLSGDTLASRGLANITNFRLGAQILPELTYNTSQDTFMIVWYDNPQYLSGPGHVRGQLVQAGTGTKLGDSFQIMGTEEEGVNMESPALAYSPIEGRYFVLGGIGSGPDLSGQYVSSAGSLEDDPFLIATSAIEEGVAPRIGGIAEAPHWFVVWMHFSDIFGRTFPDEIIGELDSDNDGLTDEQEIAGFLNQFGSRITTDPFKADTDADGIPDGVEVGTKSGGVYRMMSYPILPDSDFDGLEDFVELVDLPEPTDAFDPDSDNDGLLDGEEINDYTTDPWLADTDGDNVADGAEVRDGADPLLATERVDTLFAVKEFAIGAICGEFCIDDPEHGNIPFFIGFIISGAISVLPFGVTQVIGFIADLRDFFASLFRGDWSSFAFNLLALAPVIGEATDFASSIGKFIFRYADLVGEASAVIARLDWLPDVVRLEGLRALWGTKVLDDLGDLGFDVSRILRLSKAGVLLQDVVDAIKPLLTDYKGLGEFLSKIPIEDFTGILRGNGLTANLKKLAVAQNAGEAGRVASYLGNIKGAYTQFVMKVIGSEGWDVLQDLRHINAAGYDMILGKGGVVRLMEAKSGAKLMLRQFHSYVYKKGNELFFSVNYFLRNAPLSKPVVQEAYRSGKLQIEIFLNNPNHMKILEALQSELGVQAGEKILANYDVLISGQSVRHTVEIILKGGSW